MATKKSKPALNPQAARILEQYRNAGKALPGGEDNGPTGPDDNANPNRPTAPPPAMPRRSGTRGK